MRKIIAMLLVLMLTVMCAIPAMADEMPATPTDMAPMAEEEAAETAEAEDAEEGAAEAEEAIGAEEGAAEAEEAIGAEEAEAEEDAESDEESEPEEEEAEDPETVRAGLMLREDTFYTAPDGEAIGTLPAGAEVTILQVEDGWTMVRVAIGDEILTGYVLSDSAALYNAVPEEGENIRSVQVSCSTYGMVRLQEGMQVILSVILIGFENDEYTLQWQYSPDGGSSAIDIPGATGTSYGYFLSRKNMNYVFRVVVTYEPNARLNEQ